MTTKAEMLADPNSCLNKAADDEPLFVLRGQDKFASLVVRFWAELVADHYVPSGGVASVPVPDKVASKLGHAHQVADEMERYHTQKVPD